MRFVKTLALALTALASLPAAAQRFVDAAQFEIDTSSYVLAVGGSSQQRLAQTVSVGNTGTLAGVFLPLSCASGTVEIELRDVDGAGHPGASVLAAGSVAAADLVTTTHFSFAALPAITLFGGDSVAIVVANPSGSCGHGIGTMAGYAGGQGFFEALPNPPGWVAFSAFPGTPDDLPFQLVLMRPHTGSLVSGDLVDAASYRVDPSLHVGPGGSSGEIHAQTMTAEIGGRVMGVFLKLNCSLGDTIVELRDVDAAGAPGSVLYASTTLPYPTATPPFQTFGFVPFRTKLELRPGDPVAVVIRRNPGDLGSCDLQPSPRKGGDYAGGHAWWRTPKSAWSRYIASPRLGDDLPFQLVLR